MTNTLADYNVWLIALSLVVSATGAFAALTVSRYAAEVDGTIHNTWLLLASLVLSSAAIWGMHFVGMLSYDPGVAISYDIAWTLVSLIAPLPLTLVGLLVALRWPRRTPAWLGGGAVMGLGILSMHFTGMAGLRIAAQIDHEPMLMAAAAAIAIVASMIALRFATYPRGTGRALGALTIAAGVSGMHYTAMAAMSLRPTGAEVDYFSGAFTRDTLEMGVAVAILLALFIAVVAIIVRQISEVIRDRDHTMGRM